MTNDNEIADALAACQRALAKCEVASAQYDQAPNAANDEAWHVAMTECYCALAIYEMVVSPW